MTLLRLRCCSYTTSGTVSKNTFLFLAAAEDNQAEFRCEASSSELAQPLAARTVLTVQCE